MEINGFGGASLVLWSPRCDFQPPHIGIFHAAQVMGVNIPGINDEEAKSAGGGDNGGVMHIYEVLLLSPGLCRFARPEVKPIRQWKKRAMGCWSTETQKRGHLCHKKGKGQFVNDVQRGRRLIDTMMWPLFWVIRLIRDEILLWSSLSRLVICSKDSHQWIWGKRSKNGFGGGLAGWCFSVFCISSTMRPKIVQRLDRYWGHRKKREWDVSRCFLFFLNELNEIRIMMNIWMIL